MKDEVSSFKYSHTLRVLLKLYGIQAFVFVLVRSPFSCTNCVMIQLHARAVQFSLVMLVFAGLLKDVCSISESACTRLKVA